MRYNDIERIPESAPGYVYSRLQGSLLFRQDSEEDEYVQPFIIPDSALYYILLQRTAYQMPLSRYFRRVQLASFYDKYILKRIEILRKGKIYKLYTEDMRLE